ncbi:MAG TPA: isochorismatase family protein [Streptosporangiaceae bacterium]|nr:isochorismatase family protein [Streptosporangiaceae bacterium]
MAGLPAIAGYDVPTAERLPRNVARWVLDAERAVLLIHDLQSYFLAPFPDDFQSELVRKVASLRERCDAAGVPVAYTAQPGRMSSADRGLLRDFWGPGMRTNAADRAIVPDLAPAGQDWVFTKWRYSAFFRSDLLDRMTRAGRDQLIVCGVYAHVGVLTTALDAFTHDIQPFLVADALGDFSADYHQLALDYAAQRCAMVVATEDVLP